ASRRFGPNTAEVEAFIHAAAHLTPWQWRQVLAARRLVALVTKEGAGQAAESVRSIQDAIRSSEGKVSEPMAKAGEALFEALEKKSDEKVIAAWQAVSALVLRHQLSALKFAAHYAPFAALVPVADAEALDPTTRRFLAAIENLTAEQCDVLARPWRLDHDASRALLQAVAKSRQLNIEEAVALAALNAIPAHLTGDAGWAAVRTAVHGGRVLSRRRTSPATSKATSQLETPTRSKACATAKRATFAEEANDRVKHKQAAREYQPCTTFIPFHVDSDKFVRRLATLRYDEWAQVATS